MKKSCLLGTVCTFVVTTFVTTVAHAAIVSIDLSGASTGTLINAPGGSFAQTFDGQTVSGASIIGSPTNPLALAPSGSITVASFSPACIGCNAGNSLLPQPGNLAPLSILFDQLADSLSWVMGSADGGTSVTIDLWASDGSLVNSFVQFLESGYKKYTSSGMGTFAGLTIRDNNDSSGLRFMDFSYNSVVPVPPAVWLFGSGLLGLVGVARRKKA